MEQDIFLSILSIGDKITLNGLCIALLLFYLYKDTKNADRNNVVINNSTEAAKDLNRTLESINQVVMDFKKDNETEHKEIIEEIKEHKTKRRI